MLAFLLNIILVFAESGSSDGGSGAWNSFLHFWQDYMNYPGFEAWRFINLGIFVAIVIYLVRKPVSQAFKDKREAIRADLIKAEEERQAAITELGEVEAKLAGLESEKTSLIERAKAESEEEAKRIAEDAVSDAERIRNQAENEVKRKAQLAELKLRRFSAEESIRLAEERIKQAMNPQKDAELVNANIQSIGGMK
ncbi:MAG: ATP synthase F0 subunit B [Pyrinomonadaceae bacterium]|nr:ATP synthase F0 subunit B [Pyrinomonadaceae bacterium]